MKERANNTGRAEGMDKSKDNAVLKHGLGF